ncbi:MAG TPA: AzlC family ABC transporter permease, partial [Sedimentibacter sp.]|nr:AzlC family ABC transporter permease [Sedimentibacter sp.]
FVLTLMINARYLFYGISMLEKYRVKGIRGAFLIFSMSDETFSINCTANIPEDVDKGWFMFFVTLFNYCYWVSGSILGGLFGELIEFNTKGLEFAMTAMFIVIFMEQWLKEKSHSSSLLGLGISLLCLIIFGSKNFIIPSMILILLILSLKRELFMEAGESK